MTRHELQRVLDWTNEKLATGAEPPWAWYQYMKLRETLEAIISGIEVATPQTESSPQSELRPDNNLRLVVSTDRPDNVPRHPASVPVRLPM